jgi:peptidoglycan/LPS O-acetylase OafA/YrhL
MTLTVFTLLVGFGHMATDSTSRGSLSLFYTNSIILEFCFGVLVFVCFQFLSRFKPVPLMTACVALAVSTAVVFDGQPRMLSAGVPATFLVMTLVLYRNVPKNAGLRLLGDASYSIYLFHGTGLGWSHKVLNRVWPNAVTHPILSIVFYVTFAVAVGVVMHFVAERPILSMMRKGGLANIMAGLRRKTPTPGATQVATSVAVPGPVVAPPVTATLAQAYSLHDFSELAPSTQAPGLVSSPKPPSKRAAAKVQVRQNVVFEVPRSSLSAW